jgi:hypothetical protein
MGWILAGLFLLVAIGNLGVATAGTFAEKAVR